MYCYCHFVNTLSGIMIGSISRIDILQITKGGLKEMQTKSYKIMYLTFKPDHAVSIVRSSDHKHAIYGVNRWNLNLKFDIRNSAMHPRFKI